jgi:polyisoprenoid-binding protein YceI
MQRGIQIAVVVAAAVTVLAIGSFLYLTRTIAAPSADVQESVDQLEADNTSSVVFRVSQDDSQVEYNIYEVLNGADKTVVGTTSQVAGDILVNFAYPTGSTIGEIAINARTFETDDDRRDNSVARFILQSESDANEFITFEPTDISGLPQTLSVGDELELQVTGNLTVAGTTKEVTFPVTVTLKSEDQLSGHAETTILRSDFNLTIPNVPLVANVGDEVTLKLDFVANAV